MNEILKIDISDRQELLDLKRNELLKCGVSVVYIYYLKKGKVNYPGGKSNILYIGEALRISEPTGNRFSQHISRKIDKGADTGTNLILSQYYYNNHEIGLKIFETNYRKSKELNLIYSHIQEFACPPIAQGKIPSCPKTGKNRVTQIFNHIENNSDEIESCKKIIHNINNITNE